MLRSIGRWKLTSCLMQKKEIFHNVRFLNIHLLSGCTSSLNSRQLSTAQIPSPKEIASDTVVSSPIAISLSNDFPIATSPSASIQSAIMSSKSELYIPAPISSATTGDSNEHIRKLLKAIEHIPKSVADLNNFFDDCDGRKYGGLYIRQINIEKEQHSKALEDFKRIQIELRKMGKATGLKNIQKVMLQSYEPLCNEIANEIKLISEKVPGKDRSHYGPCLLLLPVDKLAVITLNSTLNAVLRTEGHTNLSANVLKLAKHIGDQIEAEVFVAKLQHMKKGLRPMQQEYLKKISTPGGKPNRALGRKLGALIEQSEWPRVLKVKLGAALLSFLINSAKTEEGKPVFIHNIIFSKLAHKRLGEVQLDPELAQSITAEDTHVLVPCFLPMLLPPKEWDNKSQRAGCYYQLQTKLIRSYSPAQQIAVKHATMDPVLESLNYLGQIPWRINGSVLQVAQEAWRRGLLIGELPARTNLEMPKREDCYRIPQKRVRKKKLKAETDNIDGTAPVEEVVKEDWEKEQDARDASHWTTPQFDQRYYDEMCRRVKFKNSELHSLRCDMDLKFWVAEKFTDEDKIYYPYSLDFRGRAYPVPQHLNHLRSDFCRGVLCFASAQPLGERGLHWLKVHLSNLFGNNKISFAEREQWIEEHMEDVLDSARSPLDGKQWWTQAEDPFQALATCFEISNALASGDPTTYMCRLPVHQDGSCNGLQHYAALGKDAPGAAAVNLVPSDFPQDVYSKVLEIVLRKISEDMSISEDEANPDLRKRAKNATVVSGIVNRKVIKQTVMTSVYGVTRIGASLQVQARLEERMLTDPSTISNPEVEKEIFDAARYVAGLTLESLREMFVSARSIMDWLGLCATLVATQGQVMSWVTPLGLPVMQPYRKPAIHTIKTLLQCITLAVSDDALPVYAQKQRSAFPPNFVHSLDATHMILTSLEMKKRNLTFAAVHDSYWTHPSSVDSMNESLRTCFVDLYSKPILESLRDSLVMRYPDVDFPPVPDRGELDINEVKDSPYFFH